MRYTFVSFLIFCLIVFFSIVSCSNSKNELSWGKYSESELEFHPFYITPLLGTPYSINVIDSILIIADKVEDKSLLLYNMGDSSYVRTLSIGNGPGEIIFPIDVNVSIQRKCINAFLRQTGELRVYPLDSLLKDVTSKYERVNLGLADRGMQMSEGYVALGLYEDGLLRFYNKDGSLKQKVNLYAEYGIDNVSDLYRLFQGLLSFNVLNERLAIAPSFASNVLFYHYVDGRWEEYRNFQVGDGSFEEKILNRSDLRIHNDDIKQSIFICSDKEYFYLLYDGNRMDGDQKKNYRSILCFDALTCELKHVYKVDSTVCSICVNDGKMYALFIGRDGEYTVGVATLSGL